MALIHHCGKKRGLAFCPSVLHFSFTFVFVSNSVFVWRLFCLGSALVILFPFRLFEKGQGLFLLFASLFPLAKRKSGWGICGSSFLVWLWFSFLLLQSICRLQGPFVLAQCISSLLSCKDRAFSATSATLEGKKKSSLPILTKASLPPRQLHKAVVNHGYPMVTAPIYTYLDNGSLSCVATVGTLRYPCETTGTARADSRWGLRGCRCYWLCYLRGVGHHFLLV